MTKQELAEFMDKIYNEHIQKLRQAGQAEYAGGEDAFGNFNRLATQLNMDRKSILWVYLTKHLDGIVSYLNGHKSQREPVTGRIDDAIVYLFILRGMIEEENQSSIKHHQAEIRAINNLCDICGKEADDPVHSIILPRRDLTTLGNKSIG